MEQKKRGRRPNPNPVLKVPLTIRISKSAYEKLATRASKISRSVPMVISMDVEEICAAPPN